MRYVHAMRQASRLVRDADTLQKLFEDIAPRLKGRAGGYTRVLKLGQREGDGANMALLELVCYDDGAGAEAEAAAS